MPTANFTENYAANTTLTKAQLTALVNSIEAFLNTTKLDDQNIQTGGISTANLADEVVTTAKIDDGAVTTAKLADASVTKDKLSSVGANFTGQVVMFDDYDGLLDPPPGYFPLLGEIINETNYNTIHGAGSWDTDIGSSDLDGKRTKNMSDSFPIGTDDTDDDGTTTISTLGNASSQISLQHSHTVDPHHHDMDHVHVTFSGTGTAVPMVTFDINGNGSTLSTANTTGLQLQLDTGANGASNGGTAWYSSDPRPVGGPPAEHISNTESASPGTNNQLSDTQSIQPQSHKFEYWIRIV